MEKKIFYQPLLCTAHANWEMFPRAQDTFYLPRRMPLQNDIQSYTYASFSPGQQQFLPLIRASIRSKVQREYMKMIEKTKGEHLCLGFFNIIFSFYFIIKFFYFCFDFTHSEQRGLELKCKTEIHYEIVDNSGNVYLTLMRILSHSQENK